jgi:hypothetical protein
MMPMAARPTGTPTAIPITAFGARPEATAGASVLAVESEIVIVDDSAVVALVAGNGWPSLLRERSTSVHRIRSVLSSRQFRVASYPCLGS